MAHEYGKGSTLSYNKYLKVRELIQLQETLSEPASHDELLFIIIHQTYELWFKQILHEIDATIKWMDESRSFRANHSLRAVVGIEKVLVTQIHLLETMAQIGFLEFRDKLNPASGFQSMQFRELEFVSGQKNEKILDAFKHDEFAHARLTERLAEPGLDDGSVAETEADAGRAPHDWLGTGVTDDHRWRIRGEFDLDSGALVGAALLQAREWLWQSGQRVISEADCLREVCERFLDGIESPLQRDRSKVWIHIDAATGVALTSTGVRVPDSVRDKISCDGLIQPVWETDGVPFNLGRAQHIVPERTRRIVMLRDQGCRVPGCGHDRVIEIHHVIHWVDGGPTDTWNLVALCPKHHRLHHQGKLGIAGNADCRCSVSCFLPSLRISADFSSTTTSSPLLITPMRSAMSSASSM